MKLKNPFRISSFDRLERQQTKEQKRLREHEREMAYIGAGRSLDYQFGKTARCMFRCIAACVIPGILLGAGGSVIHGFLDQHQITACERMVLDHHASGDCANGKINEPSNH